MPFATSLLVPFSHLFASVLRPPHCKCLSPTSLLAPSSEEGTWGTPWAHLGLEGHAGTRRSRWPLQSNTGSRSCVKFEGLRQQVTNWWRRLNNNALSNYYKARQVWVFGAAKHERALSSSESDPPPVGYKRKISSTGIWLGENLKSLKTSFLFAFWFLWRWSPKIRCNGIPLSLEAALAAWCMMMKMIE